MLLSSNGMKKHCMRAFSVSADIGYLCVAMTQLITGKIFSSIS